MNRTSLERALQQLSSKLGFAFHCAEEQYMARHLGTLPAAWLTPLQLKEIDGRQHGRATYDLKLHLLDKGAQLPPEERRASIARMEEQAVDLFCQLSDQPFVVAVEGLTLRPATYSLTNHGEIALRAEASVVTWF